MSRIIWVLLSDVGSLDEDLFQSADVGVLEVFKNCDLAPEGVFSFGFGGPVVLSMCSFLKCGLLNNLHGIKSSIRFAHRFHDSRKRAFSKLLEQRILLVETIARRATGSVTIYIALKICELRE